MCLVVFVFKQKTAYEVRISDCSSYVCSSDLLLAATACASIAQAQTASPVDTGAAQPQSTSPALIGPSFTVDRALELAGVVSPSLEAATADIRAAEAEIGRASCRERVCQYV